MNFSLAMIQLHTVAESNKNKIKKWREVEAWSSLGKGTSSWRERVEGSLLYINLEVKSRREGEGAWARVGVIWSSLLPTPFGLSFRTSISMS